MRSVWRSKRLWLWLALTALVVMMLGILVFLTGRYEVGQWQQRAERDAAHAVQELRAGVSRRVQTLQGTQAVAGTPPLWKEAALQLLIDHRELVLLEWRDAQLNAVTQVVSPYQSADLLNVRRGQLGPRLATSELAAACASAQRSSAAGFAGSYFLPQSGGMGQEVVELCLPLSQAGRVSGFVVALIGLQPLLSEMLSPDLLRGQLVTFTEADGTRLAHAGVAPRGNMRFVASQLFDLSGLALVLRLETGRNEPDVFPNLVTAWVVVLSVGLLTLLGVLFADIRKRQKAEGDLAQALAFRQAMEQSLVTGLRARDLDGCITYVNPAFCSMVGYSQQELIGTTNPAPYWPAERAGEYAERQSQRLAEQAQLASGARTPTYAARAGFESVFARKNGDRFPVLIVEAPLIDAKGQHLGWMSAVLDLSAQKQAEQAARASQERLQAAARLATVGEMASLLSHELNQPLAAIASYTQGAMNLIATEDQKPATPVGLDSKTDLREALQRIGSQAERAGKVIRSVNDFVRRREREREWVHPQALIDAVLPLVHLHARQAFVAVNVNMPADLADVHCDRTLVEQVLLNLARNGIQAADLAQRRDRQLSLSAQPLPSGGVRFDVADNGVGIDADAAQHLFTTFFTTKAEGMGLGLSLCRTVVEQHGGQLQFEPNRTTTPPQGTRFWFTLPTAATMTRPPGETT